MNTLDFFDSIQINSCGISDLDPDWHWDTGEDGFPDFDFWLVVQGKGQIEAAGETVEVSKGSCLILFPHVHYIGSQDPDHPIAALNVHFSLPEDQQILLRSTAPALLHRSGTDADYLRDTLRRVIRLYNADRQHIAEGVFYAALAEFFIQHHPDQRSEYSADKIALLQKICDRINDAPSTAPSLSDFAAQYGYSADYLGRIFSKGMGISFSEYTANARVNQAKFLLSSTDLPLETIADTLGYYDVCYFSRQFRRIVGTSPGRYRSARTVRRQP